MAQTINVNTNPESFPATLYFSQGDIGREFDIVLASSDGYAVPAGATVTMVATKPSGFGFSVTGTLTNNVASFVTTETMTNEAGRFPAEIRIEYNGDVIGTANFYLDGEPDPHPADTIDGDAETIIPELTVLVERVESAASSVLDMQVVATTLPAGSDATYSYDEETNTATFGIPKGADGTLSSGVLAPTYSTSATYAVGDYVYYSGSLYRCTTAITTAESWTSGHWTQVALAPEVTDLKSAIHSFYDVIKSKNLFDVSKIELGKYLNPSGSYEDLANRAVTDYIAVAEGDIVLASFISGSGIQTAQLMSSICCFDSSKSVVSGGVYNTYAFTVPSGVSFVKITLTNTVYTAHTAMIETSDTTTPSAFEPYFAPIPQIKDDVIMPKKSLGCFRWQGAMSDGDTVRLPITNVKNHQVYSFSANITTFGTVNIGRIYPNGNTYGSFEINDTNVIFHCDNGVDFTYAHGLTIENNIQVIIETTNTPFLTGARLYSNGQMYDIFAHMTQKRFIGDEGAPYVSSSGSALTDCSFSWTSRNINKPIWLFGDSYMSLYDNRWTYYLVQDGFEDSCIINAYAGEKSEGAIASLKELVETATPTYVVWCMGMNDPDDSTTVDTDWKVILDEVLAICKTNGVIPILATIPNTPTMNNYYKNEIVRNSGCRYIDFAAAVGASAAGSSWFSGMLDSSLSHPTISGAKALYMRVLADFPEITTL